MSLRICPGCGESFETQNPTKVCCSKKCASRCRKRVERLRADERKCANPELLRWEALSYRCDDVLEYVFSGEWSREKALEFLSECALGREHEWLLAEVAA